MEWLYEQGDTALEGQQKSSADAEESPDITLEERKELLLQYYGEIVRYISSFGIGEKYTEDAVQDTMVEALSCIEKLRDTSKMKYWALKIAKRVAQRYVNMNSQKNRNEEPFEDAVLSRGEKVEDISDKVLFGSLGSVTGGKLREIMDEHLSERERKILFLYYVYGHKLKEISKMIGETDSNTRRLSARAKNIIKTEMEKGGFHFE